LYLAVVGVTAYYAWPNYPGYFVILSAISAVLPALALFAFGQVVDDVRAMRDAGKD
jgi:hypothetical protein